MTRRTLAAAVTAGVVAVTAGTTVLIGPERVWEQLHGDAGSAESLHEFAHEHSGLNQRSQALASIMEKMEGGGEIAFGPQQEAYTNRAFPRTTVAQPQTVGSRAAYTASVGRGKASSKKPTGTWTLLENSTGTVPGEVTYTGHPSHVSGRVTSLAVDPDGRTRLRRLLRAVGLEDRRHHRRHSRVARRRRRPAHRGDRHPDPVAGERSTSAPVRPTAPPTPRPARGLFPPPTAARR